MAAPKLSERRVSQRYTLNHDTYIGHVVMEKTIVVPLIDISYGGFSVGIDRPEHASLCETLPKTSEVDLVILGVGTTGRAVRVFESKQRLGYAFCHDTASVLIFLRRFIEFMRLGEHLNTLDRGLLKPPYDSTDWLCFRGDGPTDLVIHQNETAGSSVDESVITFREKDSYRTAELRGGRLFTSVNSQASGSPGDRSAHDPQANDDILRKAACIVMGYLQACEDAHQPALRQLLSTLRKQLLSSLNPTIKTK
ncbi:hypothetical protein EBU99_12615 [bacterium]|nr:hypothetical protein [bacterium]